VETLTGFASRKAIPHLAFDRHRREVWQHQAGVFKKISTSTLPHILKTKEWEKYLTSQSESSRLAR
jgi:hypothetical protein